MSSNINLDGAETSIIKALGFSGAPITGKALKDAVPALEGAELLDLLQGLIAVGYVSSNRDLSRVEDIDKAMICVNSGYSKELKEALSPKPKATSTRVRRQ